MTRCFRFCMMFLGLCLSACASMVDTPNQKVQVLTPGAEGARCVLSSDYVRYIVHPPETILMRRAQEPLKVTCRAPGNRERTTFAYPRKNGTAVANIATAGIGAVYDQLSGALYKYPSPIVVDFRNTIATKYPLPAYHTPDTVSPLDQKPEIKRGEPAQVPFGDTPAGLIEHEEEEPDDGAVATPPSDEHVDSDKSAPTEPPHKEGTATKSPAPAKGAKGASPRDSQK